MAISFRGVFPILPTPFLPDESIDVTSCGAMVRRMVEFGVDGVTILGVLGEANRLTDGERFQVIEACVEAAAGQIPVVVGASHAGTKASCELAKDAIVRGADAVMVTPHAEAVPSDDKVLGHICTIADATDAPIVLQDHPGSTGVHMPLDLVLSLVAQIPTIACIKQEALPSPPRVTALKAALDRPAPILTGLGALYGAFELAAGADGFMTGFAFPEVLAAMVNADGEGAFNIHHEYLPLIVFENQPGVAVRKEIFRRRGLIAHNTVRAPGVGLSKTAAEQLEHLLTQTFATADIQQRITPGTANR
ncbi:MAG: dihydrodipicolinate synthase family protein [Gammaproteobacteria bacterium]|nr:dihydrodipicolinate synthase family protein [Gammaproteobacteria bacterium]